MRRNFIFLVSNFLRHLESLLPRSYPQQPAFALVGMPNSFAGHNAKNDGTGQSSLKSLIGDAILWAVPKHRRTVEKRLNRKFGHPEYNWKPLRVKVHLRACIHCGHDYEAGKLCTYCYHRVRKETHQMQKEIQEKLGLDPVEKDVVVMYEGERKGHPENIFQGKHIIEMPKPRPLWFAKNLLQKTTQKPSDSTEVKPNDLA